MRIALACNRSWEEVDGIRDYTFQLGGALAGNEADVLLVLREPDGTWTVEQDRRAVRTGARSLAAAIGGCDAVVLQYNPFMYGRWGFAPWLPLALLRTRLKRRRPTIVLMVHEPYVPMINWKWALMGIWQRSQLAALRLASDVVLASIEVWSERLANGRPRRPTFHLAVGSNLPDQRRTRDERRADLGVDDSGLVISCLGTAHPGRLIDYVSEALTAAAAERTRVLFLNLGAGAAKVAHLPASVEIREPGRLAPGDLASMLSTADIFLAPFVDGVSTRRGSLMAALQHGVPVVGTDGPLTDDILRTSTALRLVPVGRRDEFARAVGELAADAAERVRLGADARRLYESQFDWPVICARLLDRIGLAA